MCYYLPVIKRELAAKLKSAVKKFPIVGIVGPRQSGKTTLAKSVFPEYRYVNLEEPDVRQFAQDDPRGFLEIYSVRTIIDEVQRVPDLFSYLQAHVDRNKESGQYILTGSQNFSLMEKISQSLAGRISLFNLPPLSYTELIKAKIKFSDYSEYIIKGGYPRVFSKKIKPSDWYPNYIQTYIERDLRNMQNLTDLGTFQIFVKLCAGRVGQTVNLSSLGQDAGISHNTVKQWLSLLQAGFIIFFLPPYFKNFNKRLVKAPKLYFLDTGLATWLLGIENNNQLKQHFALGNLFENWIILEYLKNRFNSGKSTNTYFWRDKTGHEVDLLTVSEGKLSAVEIKSGKTFNRNYIDNINYLNKVSKEKIDKNFIIYGGETDQIRNNLLIYGWKSLPKLLAQ